MGPPFLEAWLPACSARRWRCRPRRRTVYEQTGSRPREAVYRAQPPERQQRCWRSIRNDRERRRSDGRL